MGTRLINGAPGLPYFTINIIFMHPLFVHSLLSNANEVCEGYVFTRVCLSTGACMAGGHAWQGVCVAGGACVARGCVWWGACMAGGHAWLGGMHALPP